MPLKFYTALIDKEAGADFGVVFPDFPGCITTGETVQEAAIMAAEALAGHIEVMLDHGDAVPDPSPPDAPLPDWLAPEPDEPPSEIVARVLIPVEMPGRSVRTNITIDEGLLGRLDAAAATAGMSRSGFIAEAVRARLTTTAPGRSAA